MPGPVIQLPTLHPGQVEAFRAYQQNRYSVIRCGRRWGKTAFCSAVGADRAAKGGLVGFFAPDYRRLAPSYTAMHTILGPIRTASSETKGIIRTCTGGAAEFWTLEDEDAGRSREYDLVIIDEAAFTKSEQMLDVWREAIRPTLLTRRGRVIVASNTNGIDPNNFLYQICHNDKLGFGPRPLGVAPYGFHAPSEDSPYVPKDEIELLRLSEHPLVFAQEYGAEFVDFSGVAFFSRDKLLDPNGQPYTYPDRCDTVFAVIDTAVKAGSANDGQAVGYYAVSIHSQIPLMLLDWEYFQMEGDYMKDAMPGIFARGAALSRQCGARAGFSGVWIEDMNTGSILLQHGAKPENNWPVHGIDTALTSLGKDGRAISVSSYVYQGQVKFSDFAYNKIVNFKGTEANHMLSQVTGFRVGDKDAAKRADDCLDVFCYGISLSLGSKDGF